MKEIKKYSKESSFSYTAGTYATIELLTTRPEQAERVVIHSDYKDTVGLLALCREKSVTVQYGDHLFKKINQKENTYVLGQFTKYNCRLATNRPHVVLVNPSDMGNLGTTMRTLVAVNINNLAIVTPAADHFNPKTIRASMGAIFKLEIESFSSFEEYRRRHGLHKFYPFMLQAKMVLGPENCPIDSCYSLIFGNEASGLPECFLHVGTGIKLPQTAMVDSMNLSVAVGIGSFLFANANGHI